jgi:hypothetical protein
MPFELRDFQDLVRLLREHPDWRDVQRAEQRAALLRQVRYPTVAVAAGTEATAGAQQAASEEGVALLRDGRIDGWQEALDHMRAEGETGH